MIKACILGSGSKGNSIYFQVDDRQFLVDCGFTKKQITKRLAMIGRRLEDIENIFITHDHKDHCAPWILKEGRVPGILPKNVRQFQLSHDSECVGYTITDNAGNKVVIAVDTGCISEEALKHFFDASIVMIETSYDTCMMENSQYPSMLKRRIQSDTGHLRLECAAEVVGMVAWPGLKYVVGLHLSSTCINPVLARFELEAVFAFSETECEVVISEQGRPTQMMVVI
jgi:phosphoribosyl 1,2-cyclic phosphodiesterase